MRNGVRDVLVHVTIRYRPTLEHGAFYALALSAVQGARATVILSDIEPWAAPMGELDTVQDGGDPPVAITRTKYIERISRLLETEADEHRVACDILVSDIQGSSAAAAAQLARYARVRDLVILSAYGPLQYPRLDLVQAVLFRTGRPLLLVPPEAGPFRLRTAVVAWDATPAASRALFDAMPLLTMAAEVIVVTVLGDKELQPEEAGTNVCRALASRNIAARFEPVQDEGQDVAATLLQVTARAQADLLVMGGFAHGPEREFLFGSATRSLWRSGFRLPVLLSH
jgi:nucleotide-binding universal stress UspA family protein